MNKKELILTAREKYPDNKSFKRMMTKIRLMLIHKESPSLPKKQITACESDRNVLSDTMKKYMEKHPEKVKMINKNLAKFDLPEDYDSLEKKEFLLADICFCQVAYGFTVDEYMTYRLFEKNAAERRQFFSDRDRRIFAFRMNDIKAMGVFLDKYKTYEKTADLCGREAIKIGTPSDYTKFLKFIERHPVFVKKIVYGSMGNSVELVDSTKWDKTPKVQFDKYISKGWHILEELIEQSDKTKIINPSSVNTVRCFTLNTRHGVIVDYCFMRCGRNGAFVDNGGAGGIFAAVDPKTGTVNSIGYDEAGKTYETHPDSGIRFMGFQYPEWGALLEVCKKAAKAIQGANFIGWDLAYTDDKGWLIVEGNSAGQQLIQILENRGIKNELLDIMRDMDLVF